MAKIQHSNLYDIINEILTGAIKKGIIHLHTDINETPDRKLKISGKEVLNFGTCGYLGLELDQRLIDGGIEMMQKYGTQFSVSRAYLMSGIQEQLEKYLSQMFDNSPVITFSSTTLAHISLVPHLVNYNDAVILDQQVHISVQNATQLLRQKGTLIEKIRHNNLEMLEDKVKELSQKHEKVWYMVDGVYSMFGDLAPIDDLVILMEKYPKLYVYADDAHGMGWDGKNGVGYVFSKAPKHPKIVLVTTLAKGFGVMGGLAVFPDEKMYNKVNTYGGPLGYSHPLTPALIGSSIASAKILLSDEGSLIQTELQERMEYCNTLLAKTNLTVLSNPLTPINFIGIGGLKVGYNMVKKLLDDGFYVNIAMFPVVPLNQTGLRFTITRHIQKNDIKQLVDAIVYHYPKVLEEEGRTSEDVKKAFGQEEIKKSTLPLLPQKVNVLKSINEFKIEQYSSISSIDIGEWDLMLGKNGLFDWAGLMSLEQAFKNNLKPEENWEFYYFIIRDSEQRPVFATFFTSTIIKDDMLALEGISFQIEEERKKNPYYLTSRALMMGSMITDGLHYYLNKKNPNWKRAVTIVLEKVAEIRDEIDANILLLRDFDKEDVELKDLITQEGFAIVEMPNANVIENMKWNTQDELLKFVSTSSRKHIKKEVFKYEDMFEVEYKYNLTEEEIVCFYDLYLNVQKKNYDINIFPYPEGILYQLSKSPFWEFIVLKLKPEYDNRKERKAVAVVWCYVSNTHYCPVVIGLNYEYAYEYKVYKQAIFQVLKRARMLGFSEVYLGLSADTEKHKFGAKQKARIAYIQTKDNFNMEVIESMATSNSILY